MLRRTHPLAAAIVAVALVHGPAARASAAPSVARESASETPSEAETLSSEAVAAFKAKEFDVAIEKFERAYALDPQPNYKFNIGRVYEEKGDLENAVTYYQQFVQSPGVDLEAREAATARLKVLRLALQELRAEEAKAREAEAAAAKTEVATDQPSVEDGAKARKRKLRIAGYSLLGAGGVGLVIGSAFAGLALSSSRKSDDEPLVEDKLARREQAKSRAMIADAMLVTGGVLAGVGLILVLATLGKGKRSKATAWLPRTGFGPRGASLSWTARF